MHVTTVTPADRCSPGVPGRFATGLLAVALAAQASPLLAQDLNPRQGAEPPASPTDAPAAAGDEIGFTADQLLYDNERDVVTATGNVVVRREGNLLRADSVTWNRASGEVVAEGDVAVTTPDGLTAYGQTVRLDDTLRDGIVKSLLIVTEEGDRIAALQGERRGAIFILNRAAYSACKVVDDKGCPKEPTWQIKAARVVYNSDTKRVRYVGARVELFGLPLIPLPGLSHTISNRAASGFLVPEIGFDSQNGAQLSLPYFVNIAPNRDLTLTGHLYSDALPMLQGRYRALVERGAYQVSAYGTYGRRTGVGGQTLAVSEREFRGYVDASGRFQLDPAWSVSGALRRVTDRTFLDRYDISRDDRLRSNIAAERIGDRSYLSIEGWSFQTLRPGDPQGQVPIALPAIDYRLRLADPLLSGTVELQANSLAIIRTAGQDTQRAFASGTWSLRRLTTLGQEVSLTGFVRGDVYHSTQNALTATASYRGSPGWQSRGIAALALDARWPFAGPMLGGTQYVAPRAQLVVAPKVANLSLPNEDARAVDLEDSNLFALNRFPGYDRFEDSTRLTLGIDYRYDRPFFSVEATVGQSFRLNSRETILPDGTGLSERVSDVVGRIDVRYRDFVSVTHRFRLDKDDFSVRRNEVEATVGSRQTYARVSYLRLARNIDTVEDLADIEEVRLAGRVAIGPNWSVFGSTAVDLTGKDDDPLTTLDGYTPVRHRVGIAYQNECIELGFTWQREYQSFGDASRGNSYLVRLAFRNLGL